MKIICMDCQNETHLEVETLKDKKKMSCAHCEEKAQAAPAVKTSEWSAPSRYEEPKSPTVQADYAFEVAGPQVDEVDVLEIPDETGLELYDPERAAAAEEVVLYEPEIYPPLEALRADPVEDVPEEMIVSAAHDHTEPVPGFTPHFDSSPEIDFAPRFDFATRQEAAPAPLPEPALSTEPASLIEIVPPAIPPAETPAPQRVKLLKFSTASLAAGLTVFLAFIFFGDKILRSSSDISSVAAAPTETKAPVQPIKKQAAVTAPTPAPQPSSTPAPTPEPTPEPTPAPQETKQAETAPPPVDVQQNVAGGRFAVQVGSYNEVGQANERAEKLRANGFDPRVVSVELPKRGTWFRVMVGSFNDRAEANRFGAQMRAKGAAQDFVIADL